MKQSETHPLHLILKDTQLFWGNDKFSCTWGKGGMTSSKVEGDGATPIGSFPFRKLYYRPDRLQKPKTCLPLQALTPKDGWCDDPTDAHYNKFVSLPYSARHEQLWREDHVYDLILVVGYNDDPVVKGKGSAIFVHLQNPKRTPTEGCVAFSQEDLLKVLREASLKSCLVVQN